MQLTDTRPASFDMEVKRALCTFTARGTVRSTSALLEVSKMDNADTSFIGEKLCKVKHFCLLSSV